MSGSVTAPSPPLVVAAGAIWPPLCVAVVALRFYTRRLQNARLMLDDWLTVPAAILTIGLGAMLIYGWKTKALGYPTPPPAHPNDALTNNSRQVRINRLFVWTFQLVQIPALACVKLSFIFFYRRIFCTGIGTRFRKVTLAAIVLITAWAVAFEFTFLFICRGHFAAWWQSIKSLDQYCHPELDMEVGFATTDFITDAIVIVMPLPLIWRLKMSFNRRIATILIFCLGSLSIAASITRMVIFIRAVEDLKKAYKSSGANDLITTAGLYWSMIESSLGLVAACLPTIYALFKTGKAFSKLDGRYQPRGSISSDFHMVTGLSGPASTDTQALKEPDAVFRRAEPPNGQIFVQKSFQTREDIV